MTYEEIKALEIPLGKAKNLTGMKFGKLTTLFRVENKTKKVRWACLCECGNYCIVSRDHLLRGTTMSCGCEHYKKQDITGQKFKHLTAIRPTGEKSKSNSCLWFCECDCGATTIASVSELNSGGKVQCEEHPYRKYIGKSFGELTITSFAYKNEYGVFYWYADCSCGKKNLAIAQNSLISGQTNSCGHLKGNKKDITGEIFGHLTAVEPTDKRDNGSVVWTFKCDCGCTCEKSLNDVKYSDTISCGHIKSQGESNMKEILSQNNIMYIYQMYFDICRFPDTNKLAKFDFYVLTEDSHLIEFDGEQHFNYTNIGWNTKEKFLNTHNHDLFKNQWAWDNEITVKRIPYKYRDSLTLEDLLSDKFIITPQTHPWYYPEANSSYPYFSLETIDQCIN